MKGTSGITIAGLFVVLIIFTIGLFPAMQAAMGSATLDPFSTQMMYLVPMGFFVAILVGILFYSFSGNSKQMGQ
jgi:hypothetical protein